MTMLDYYPIAVGNRIVFLTIIQELYIDALSTKLPHADFTFLKSWTAHILDEKL